MTGVDCIIIVVGHKLEDLADDDLTNSCRWRRPG